MVKVFDVQCKTEEEEDEEAVVAEAQPSVEAASIGIEGLVADIEWALQNHDAVHGVSNPEIALKAVEENGKKRILRRGLCSALGQVQKQVKVEDPAADVSKAASWWMWGTTSAYRFTLDDYEDPSDVMWLLQRFPLNTSWWYSSYRDRYHVEVPRSRCTPDSLWQLLELVEEFTSDRNMKKGLFGKVWCSEIPRECSPRG